MNLYKITIKATLLNEDVFVVAAHPTEACEKLEKALEPKSVSFEKIEIIAEELDHKKQLFL